MLKKIVSLLLALLLALGAATSALAMAVSMSTFDTDGENDTIVSIAAAGSTLYILYQSGRLVSRPVSSGELTELGEATCTAYYADAQSIPTEDGKAAFDKLFVSDGQLLALLTATGEMYRVLDDQGLYAPEKLPEKLDTSVLVEKDDEYSSLLSLTSLFAQDGFLYYTGASYSGGYSTTAGRINLKTGAAQVFNTKNLTSLVPYQDGKVLAMSTTRPRFTATPSARTRSAPQRNTVCSTPKKTRWNPPATSKPRIRSAVTPSPAHATARIPCITATARA